MLSAFGALGALLGLSWALLGALETLSWRLFGTFFVFFCIFVRVAFRFRKNIDGKRLDALDVAMPCLNIYK